MRKNYTFYHLKVHHVRGDLKDFNLISPRLPGRRIVEGSISRTARSQYCSCQDNYRLNFKIIQPTRDNYLLLLQHKYYSTNLTSLWLLLNAASHAVHNTEPINLEHGAMKHDRSHSKRFAPLLRRNWPFVRNTESQPPTMESTCSRATLTWTYVDIKPFLLGILALFFSLIKAPHGVEEIMKTICHDDIVIDGDDEGQNDHGDTNSHGTRQHLHPDGKGADLYSLMDESKIRNTNCNSSTCPN